MINKEAAMDGEIKYTYLIARDVERMRDFYAGSLGLPVKFQDAGRWCQMDGGRVDFPLSCAEEAQPCPSGFVTVFRVQSLEAAAAKVETAGGKVVHRRSMGDHGAVITCVDIEENFFQLFARAGS